MTLTVNHPSKTKQFAPIVTASSTLFASPNPKTATIFPFLHALSYRNFLDSDYWTLSTPGTTKPDRTSMQTPATTNTIDRLILKERV